MIQLAYLHHPNIAKGYELKNKWESLLIETLMSDNMTKNLKIEYSKRSIATYLDLRSSEHIQISSMSEPGSPHTDMELKFFTASCTLILTIHKHLIYVAGTNLKPLWFP